MKTKGIIVTPGKSRLVHLLKRVRNNQLFIPEFQRDFVWEEKQMMDLLDSINRGFPIGSLLFWKPKEKYKIKTEIGPFLAKGNEGGAYILDGYQRISTLFGCLENPEDHNVNKESKKYEKYRICYDLKEEQFVHAKGLRSIEKNDLRYIPLYVMVDTFLFLNYKSKLYNSSLDSNEYIKKADELSTTFQDYEVSFIEINGGEMNDAVEIYSRVNSKGTKMSKDWMLSALTYAPGQFLLSDAFDEFLEEMEELGYGNISRDTILQCIESSYGKPYFDIKIESKKDLKKLEGATASTLENIKKAIMFLRSKGAVINYRLLPYNIQLILVTEFFRLIPSPTEGQLGELENWFWVTTYTGYFTIYSSLSYLRKTFRHFYAFSKGDNKSLFSERNSALKLEVSELPEDINMKGARRKAYILFSIRWIRQFELDDMYVKDVVLSKLQPKRKGIGQVVVDFYKGNKKKDYKLFLDNYSNESERFFINESIVRNYKKNKDINEVERGRRNLILSEEEKFVSYLGLIYPKEEESIRK